MTGRHHVCALGYSVKWFAFDEHGFTVHGIPQEPCPKPLTQADYLYAREWYMKPGGGAI